MRLSEALGIPVDPYRYEPNDRLILPKCRLGLEFEFEGVTTEKVDRHVGLPLSVKEPWSAYWRVTADGSLHDNGAEFRFERPLWGADAVSAVESLCTWAKARQFKTSIRTGLHVHVDVRDLSRDELSRLNVLYALFERAVYRVAGNNRDTNVFCLPWYKADNMANHVRKINSAVDLKSASSELRDEKYGGLNLDTLVRFGSVEFRHALATTDVDWVLKWINVCLAFKRAAQKLDTSPLALIHNLSAVGVPQFARTVFEDVFGTIDYPELETEVWAYGVDTALLVYPQQQEIIDIANLSWNKAPVPVVVNPKFQAYVDKKKLAVAPAVVWPDLEFNQIVEDDDDDLVEVDDPDNA